MPWKWIRRTTWVLALAILISLIFLSSIPFLSGKRVSNGLSPAMSLCGMDRDGSVQVLIAGDCRAKLQVIPDTVTHRTGLTSINVGELLPWGGDLTTLVNSLRQRPIYLSQHPILVISVSPYELDDYETSLTTVSIFFNWRLIDHWNNALHNPSRYFPVLGKVILPSLKKEFLHAWRHDGFSCSDSAFINPMLMKAKGFRVADCPIETIPGEFKEERDKPSVIMKMEGANWRIFKQALVWLEQSEAGRVILYNAPVNPTWKKNYPHSKIHAMQETFSAMMEEWLVSHPKIIFLDYYRHPLAALDSSAFADRIHLNLKGAQIFSGILSDEIVKVKGP